MGVDVADLFGFEAGISERPGHSPGGAVLGARSRMVCLGRRGESRELTMNLGAAIARVFQLLENEDAGALPQDESGAILVEGAAGAGGIVAARRQGTKSGKARHDKRRHKGVRPARDHDVGIAALNQAQRVADSLGARGAGCGRARENS
jgi:hypothetical protein